ncbi:MAG: hypothetical protein EA397_16010 [Deltaproteobacteria bacterium]|nr:MAG: hypothetical protein EA397_16010 [Deltaproteobacteria bacterium]
MWPIFVAGLLVWVAHADPSPASPVDPSPQAQAPVEAPGARARLPSYAGNQHERHGLGVHPHEPIDHFIGDGLEGHAWARVGYLASHREGGLEHGPYLGMARLQLRMSDGQRFSAFVQLGADRGELALLDAKIRAKLSERLVLAIGRMKTPVSHDFLVPASQMLLPTRALLDNLSPMRAVGVQARYVDPHPRWTATFRAGIFDPMEPGSPLMAGPQLIAQTGIHTSAGFFGHLAGAAWLRDKEIELSLVDGATSWDRQLDLAAGWSNEGWTFEAEGLIARHADEGRLDGGATLLAAGRAPLGPRLVLEPVLAGDVRSREEMVLRGTLGVNLHEQGWHLVETLAWEIEGTRRGRPMHRVMLQVQAGL